MTADITAPTVAVGERLQDSQATIDGLLARLATTESESEREALEIELSRERRHAAGVTLIGLAVIAPLALIAPLVWLVRRTWLRWTRSRALA